MKINNPERARAGALRKLARVQSMIDRRGRPSLFTLWRLNAITRKIEKLDALLNAEKAEPFL